MTTKPALPEPVAYADAANLRAALEVDDMPIIAWPCGGELNGRFFYEPLYTADQLRTAIDAAVAEARTETEALKSDIADALTTIAVYEAEARAVPEGWAIKRQPDSSIVVRSPDGAALETSSCCTSEQAQW